MAADEIRRQPSGSHPQRCRREAMILAERAGLDPRMVVDMVGPGAGGSRMFQMRAPMMVEGIYEPATMKVSTWKKDMAIIAEFADDVGCATPMFTLTQPVYARSDGDGTGRSGHRGGLWVLKKTIVRIPNLAPGSRNSSHTSELKIITKWQDHETPMTDQAQYCSASKPTGISRQRGAAKFSGTSNR